MLHGFQIANLLLIPYAGKNWNNAAFPVPTWSDGRKEKTQNLSIHDGYQINSNMVKNYQSTWKCIKWWMIRSPSDKSDVYITSACSPSYRLPEHPHRWSVVSVPFGNTVYRNRSHCSSILFLNSRAYVSSEHDLCYLQEAPPDPVAVSQGWQTLAPTVFG